MADRADIVDAGPGRHIAPCELLLAGARVIDPETGLDAVRNVGITDGRITAVTSGPVAARTVVDVSGLVLAPGFVDIHSHAQTVSSLRLQALDGVTTALELESGAASLPQVYREVAAEGRPINYGYSASWAMARMRVMDGIEPVGGFLAFTANARLARWQRPATGRELDRVLAVLEEQLHEGALGVGILVGYAPQTGRREFYRVAELAARSGAPTFTHARFRNRDDPETALEGVAEVVTAALGTGAHMHLCHVNSTSLRAIDEVAELIGSAQQHGVRVTTEAYPYGAGMTMIGAAHLHPDELARVGVHPSDLVVVATGERPADAARLHELRAGDPGALTVVHYLDEQNADDWSTLERALLLPGSAVASDAIPFTLADGRVVNGEWPLPDGALSHPRTTGTFSRFVGTFARDRGVLTLSEAIRRCTLVPAQVMEQIAPGMRRKGRVQVGADADIVVFDLTALSDQSTYADPGRSSRGVHHLLVGGRFVVRDAALLLDSLPGTAVRGQPR